MNQFVRLAFAGLLVLGVLFAGVAAYAQTAATGVVLGTVTDPQQAAVAGAKVQLYNEGTGQTQEQTTDASGQYVFASVPPGPYKITVTMKSFRTTTLPNFQVSVAKSYTVNVTLEVGEVTEVVQVEATSQVELQTTDATVGNVIATKDLQSFPALTRQVNELLTLQPGATPGGEVTGARSDQSTFTLDGIDVTNNSIGGLATFAFLPIDSIEEFRVSVANPNASFGRGAGGQASLVTRSATEQYHGAVYWYHQNDNLNANSWENTHKIVNGKPTPKAELKDNRFGARAGGPVPLPWNKNRRTFLFGNYEGRRFPGSTLESRVVPTALLKQGILQFRDGTSTVRSYNLATASNCGAAGTGVCDPRRLGISPSVQALWNFFPAGNDPSVSGADGLNTTGFTADVGTPLKNDFYDIKLDQDVTSKWRANVAFRYFRQAQISSAQINFLGGGTPTTSRSLPTRQNMILAGLVGQITPRLSADFHFGWVRNRTATAPMRPNVVAALENIPGMNTSAGPIAIDVGNGSIRNLVDEPIDVGTQVARKQSNDNRNFQWNADFVWARGTHTLQFGTHIRYLPTLHLRDDKVIGALGALVAQLDAARFSIPVDDRPPTCGGGVTTNCVTAGDVSQWDRLYAATLGLVDNISVLAVRDGSFKPLPFGNLLESDTKLWAPEFYVADTWRLKSSLTLSLGLNYGWQTAPVEKLGRQTVQIDAGTGRPITAASFIAQRAAAMNSGTFFNPTFGFVPINSAGRSVFDVDYRGWAPRVAVAWNPSYGSGWAGRLLGQGKTVVRGGFGLVYDRQNTVQSVIIPALGVGFAQTLNLSTPACNITGAGGTLCNAGSTNSAFSIFRVGRDGTPPVPVVPAQANPVVPVVTLAGGRIQFPEVFSFQLDPSIKVGRNYAVDLSVQRELPFNMLLEVDYTGRLGRDLPQSMSLGQSPIFFKDPTSGQTFAEAFDAVATQLRAGTAPAAVTPQPWFQNLSPGGTVVLASGNLNNFINGNVSNIFQFVDTRRMQAALPTFNNYLAQGIFFRSSTGTSNYHALLVTLNKRVSRGLTFTTNYTWSHSLDQIGAVQNAASLMPNSFNLDAEYGPSGFDFRQIFNAKSVYDLPFRSSNKYLKRMVEGWYASGIYTAISGQPLTVTEGNQVWGGTLALGFSTGVVPTVDLGSLGAGVHSGVAGSGGIGTTNPSGVNLFADPAAALGSFRPVLLSQDGRSGRSRPIRGLPHWNLDTSIGKTTAITERVKTIFAADFFNIFNHLDLCDPGATNGNGGSCGGSLNLTTPKTFGVISSQFIPANRTSGSRWIQFSLRFEF
jgi:hypothetical protein